jgi:hypothetical protein
MPRAGGGSGFWTPEGTRSSSWQRSESWRSSGSPSCASRARAFTGGGPGPVPARGIPLQGQDRAPTFSPSDGQVVDPKHTVVEWNAPGAEQVERIQDRDSVGIRERQPDHRGEHVSDRLLVAWFVVILGEAKEPYAGSWFLRFALDDNSPRIHATRAYAADPFGGPPRYIPGWIKSFRSG